jgi:hypothetical protein
MKKSQYSFVGVLNPVTSIPVWVEGGGQRTLLIYNSCTESGIWGVDFAVILVRSVEVASELIDL